MNKNIENMLKGLPYLPDDPELVKYTHLAHRLCRDYNLTTDIDKTERQLILDKLLPQHGQDIYLQGPIGIDYGRFIKIGDHFYANFNLTILDECPVTIGKNVKFGPNVSLVTPLHPLLPEQRNPRLQPDGNIEHYEYAAPITIGDNCWLATNVTVCPGVKIGANCVIGAGSVVTHDLPANSVAVGVPAKVMRQLSTKDRLTDFPY